APGQPAHHRGDCQAAGHADGAGHRDRRSPRQYIVGFGAAGTGRSGAVRPGEAWPAGAARGLRRRLHLGLGADALLTIAPPEAMDAPASPGAFSFVEGKTRTPTAVGTVRAGTDDPAQSLVSCRAVFAGSRCVTGPGTDHQLAFVFPGQGSQSIGMLAELAQAHPTVAETFAEASESAGTDLWTLARSGPEDRLNQTEFTQPALLAAGVAVWRAWAAQAGPRPAQLAGHSLGEYSALVAAGVLSLGDAARLVRLRGQLMQDAAPAGTG